MTRLSEPWGTTRPYSDVRFSGGQHYHRPDLNLWPLFIHQAEILTLTGIAAVATGVLLGIRVWQRITEPFDETGD